MDQKMAAAEKNFEKLSSSFTVPAKLLNKDVNFNVHYHSRSANIKFSIDDSSELFKENKIGFRFYTNLDKCLFVEKFLDVNTLINNQSYFRCEYRGIKKDKLNVINKFMHQTIFFGSLKKFNKLLILGFEIKGEEMYKKFYFIQRCWQNKYTMKKCIKTMAIEFFVLDKKDE